MVTVGKSRSGYRNTRTDEFIDIAVAQFLDETEDLKPEGMLAWRSGPTADPARSHAGPD